MLTNYFSDMSYKDKVYVNQDESFTDLQTLIKYSLLLNFLHESLMHLIIKYKIPCTSIIWSAVPCMQVLMHAGTYACTRAWT